jgi:glutamate formiminotransferase/formiminotetrahydrofolate cyclodeaminase
VGLIPYPALLEAGRYYLRAQSKSPFIPIPDVLQTAIHSMGLSDLAPFDVAKKVLGLPHAFPVGLAAMPVTAFADEVSRDTPAPGGGSVAALAGALGAALASMVANLWQDKVDSPAAAALLGAAEAAQRAKDQLVLAIDEDTNAFTAYMEARRLPANTPEEKALREARMQAGLKQAVGVPYQTALASLAGMQAAATVIEQGHVNSLTDGAVGLQMGYAGVRGAIWNVLINLKDIADPAFVREMRETCGALLEDAHALLTQASQDVDKRLVEMIDGGKVLSY